jgi:hypothetical protein
LALIDAVRFFGDKYILFHGITTMFRLGDASLADPATQRIVGIGELKTTRIDKNRLNMHFQASMQAGVSITPLAPAPADMAMPPPKQRARLDKQMARISRAAADADRPPHVKIEINVGDMAYVGELNALVPQAIRGKVAMRQMSPGLVVLAYCSGQRTLLSRLRNISSIPKDALSGLTELTKNVMLDGSAHNMLLINRAFYSDTWEPVVMAGATPMLMWHLDAEVKRVLATGEVVIVTLYNPAHVFRDFIEQGWSFGRFTPPTEFSLRRERNGKTMEIGNVQYFLQLISNALYREDYVSRLVAETWTRMEAQDLTGERIDLNFTHHVYF